MENSCDTFLDVLDRLPEDVEAHRRGEPEPRMIRMCYSHRGSRMSAHFVDNARFRHTWLRTLELSHCHHNAPMSVPYRSL